MKVNSNKELNGPALLKEATSMLFCDMRRSIEDIALYWKDLQAHPEKAYDYIPKLEKDLHDTLLEEKSMLAEVKRGRYCKRITEWTNTIGTPSLTMLIYMSNFSGIAYDRLSTGRITPNSIKEVLDQFVIGQENYKTQLAISFYLYLLKKRGSFSAGGIKSNILVMGPSGAGKTYGIQTLTRLFDVPIGTVHCNGLVQEGIIGQSISDTWTELYLQYGERVKYAIIIFDELDKLFGKGYYNERILNEMLNIIDDHGEVQFPSQFGSRYDVTKITIPTDKMMFVFTGVFAGLDQIVKKRLNIGSIGFSTIDSQETDIEDLMAKVSYKDFEEYGIRTELLGRIQNYTYVKELTQPELVEALQSPFASPFIPYKEVFSEHGIHAELTGGGMMAIAELSQERHLGVRGLKSILYDIFRDDMADMLSNSCKRELIIDAEYVYKAIRRSEER